MVLLLINSVTFDTDELDKDRILFLRSLKTDESKSQQLNRQDFKRLEIARCKYQLVKLTYLQ